MEAAWAFTPDERAAGAAYSPQPTAAHMYLRGTVEEMWSRVETRPRVR